MPSISLYRGKGQLSLILAITFFLSTFLALIPSKSSAQDLKLGEKTYELSGPHIMGNLSVYLLHSQDRDDREFITLEEGLKSGLVEVTEQPNATVQKLLIVNRSKKPLFLQEGDRVIGGKQDRTVQTSVVIAPGKEPVPLPAFCVEQSRWREGSSGKSFKGGGNQSISPQSTRISSKYANDQGRVWQSVAQNKAQVSEQYEVANTNSSLTESMDSKEIRSISETAMKEYMHIVKSQKDVVGAVFVINGKVVETDVYAGHPLFLKTFPRLVGSMAMDASLKKAEYKEDELLGSPTIKQVIQEVQVVRVEKQKRILTAGHSNSTNVQYNEDGSAQSESTWKDLAVHSQYMPSHVMKASTGNIPSVNAPLHQINQMLNQEDGVQRRQNLNLQIEQQGQGNQILNQEEGVQQGQTQTNQDQQNLPNQAPQQNEPANPNPQTPEPSDPQQDQSQ